MSSKDTPARQRALAVATFERLTNKKPMENTVPILLDPRLSKTVDDARAALSVAQSRVRISPDDAVLRTECDRAAAAVADAVDAAASETVTMTFRAIGRLAFDDLISRHPPSDAQKEKSYGWNPDTFGPALISASLAEPKLSVDEVNQLLASPSWNNAESALLFNTALEVNNERRTADLGKD